MCRCVASGAGYDPGRDAQTTAHGLPLSRRAARGFRLGAGARVGLPVALTLVVSHHIPPLVPGVHFPPDLNFTVEFADSQHQAEPLMGWFTREP